MRSLAIDKALAIEERPLSINKDLSRSSFLYVCNRIICNSVTNKLLNPTYFFFNCNTYTTLTGCGKMTQVNFGFFKTGRMLLYKYKNK